MEMHIAENIRNLRKQRNMMQEQLAEALGVSIAAVSKWERGIAMPDLSYIVEMADLFEVSLDALVGFEVQNGGAVALEQRIHDLQREKKYEEAVIEAEKALVRYPNDFRIAYRAGDMYEVAGIELKKEKYIYRSIELLEHSILLLSQNTDPDLSEFTIQNQMAQSYLVLGKKDKSLEILKKYNVSGVHNPLIALTYTCSDCYDPNEVTPYLMRAFGDILTATIRTMMSYVKYYDKLGDLKSCLDSILWLIGFLESVKIDVNSVAYVDKLLAPCYSECANLSYRLGQQENLVSYLRRAYALAKAFDAAPSYKVKNIKFCVGDVSNATVYDDLGGSAMAAVEHQITQESNNEILYGIWMQIVEEDSKGGLQ